MKCPNCGETSRIREHDKYCHKCGANLQASSADKKGGVVGAKKVDELISELAEHITRIILSGEESENEVADKTKALADLINARASYQNFDELTPIVAAK